MFIYHDLFLYIILFILHIITTLTFFLLTYFHTSLLFFISHSYIMKYGIDLSQCCYLKLLSLNILLMNDTCMESCVRMSAVLKCDCDHKHSPLLYRMISNCATYTMNRYKSLLYSVCEFIFFWCSLLP